MKLKIFISATFLLLTLNLFSQDYFTISSGDWNDGDNWQDGVAPAFDANVFVYHDMELTSTADVQFDNVSITNQKSEDASIQMTGDFLFKIEGDLNIEALNKSGHCGISISDDVNVNVVGDIYQILRPGIAQSRSIFVNLEGRSAIICEGNFSLDHNGFVIGEKDQEFTIDGNSTFSVGKNASIKSVGGNDLNFNVLGRSVFSAINDLTLELAGGNEMTILVDSNAKLKSGKNFNVTNNGYSQKELNFTSHGEIEVFKNFNLTSSDGERKIEILLDGLTSWLKVEKDLNMNASAANDVALEMINESSFDLKGSITRPQGFGQFTMSNDANFTLSGGGLQTIDAMQGDVGEDIFTVSNLTFKSEDTIRLMGNIQISNLAELTTGVVKTTSDAMLILENGAQIIGGSPNAYIEGPMKIVEPLAGSSFTFPVGHEGTYAPMTLDILSGRAAGSEYTVNYMSCPPPWGLGLAPNMTSISNQEHWVLERSAKEQNVNVQLHWTDAAAQGLTTLDDLVVSMYNPDATTYPGFQEGWTSIGNGGTTGGVGSGASGAIMNIGTCPPPWGIQEFTFGYASAGVLPVEMESFKTELSGEVVDIDWTISNQIGVDYYDVEKSINGYEFETLTTITAKEVASYFAKDQQPIEGINYYRIKQIDLNGMVAYSDIKSINYEQSASVVAFPNPVQDELVLKGSFLRGVTGYQLSDLNGKVLQSSSINATDGFYSLTMEELNIEQSGIYMLELIGASKRQSIRLVKQ